MINKNKGASVVMSPFSVLIPLAELALYTEEGNSFDQLMNVLNLNDKDEVNNQRLIIHYYKCFSVYKH